MLDTGSMKKDVLNIIANGTLEGGAAAKKKKGKKSSKTKTAKTKSPKSKSSKTAKKTKQPIGYVWKMSNVNGKITRELHPIYKTSTVNQEIKMMEKRMNKMLKNLK